MRLLTLQGQWLETKARMVAEDSGGVKVPILVCHSRRAEMGISLPLSAMRPVLPGRYLSTNIAYGVSRVVCRVFRPSFFLVQH